MAEKKKYYAVRVGRKTGIFENWDECKSYVTGFPGATFKGFATLQEAEDFMSGAIPAKTGSHIKTDSSAKTGSPAKSGSSAADDSSGESTGRTARKTSADEVPTEEDGRAVAYVDGSFDITTGRYSYGCVIFVDGEEIVRLSEAFADEELALMRNVAGEIEGSMAAMRYCAEHGIAKVSIYHDYEGIAKWCTGEWKANKNGTIAYRDFYKKMAGIIDVRFVKVKGHSGNRFNDLVDSLAKGALGLL